MTPEQKLFQAVIFQAVRDATQDAPESLPRLSALNGDEKKMSKLRNERKKRLDQIAEADKWFREARKDFVRVCDLAGMCPEFVRDAYVSGKIDRDLLGSFTH